ncbi:MAG: SIR2 family protein [candidate division Zixibacteria bacterium]
MNYLGFEGPTNRHQSYLQNPDEELKPKEKQKCPAVFFFGAGASKPADVPTTVEFVEQFGRKLKGKELEHFEKLKDSLVIHQEIKQKVENPPIDIEMILENLVRLEESEEDPLLSILSISMDIDELKKLSLSKKLKSFIKEKGIVQPENTLYLKPLRDLITIYNSIGIISTNYDIVIEQFCNSQKLKLEDGFGNVFEFDRLRKDGPQIKLYKIHGSILWYRSKTGQFYKLPVETKGNIKTVFGEELEPLIIYPMRKWQYIEPTFEIINEAKKIMRDPDIKLIYVFGYSFRDDHVLDIFLDVFRDRTDLYCVLVDPDAYNIYEKRLRFNDEGKTTESSMAGRVICKPFTIQTELESFYPATFSPLLEALEKLEKFWNDTARHGTWNWSHPACSLLKSNFITEFERLRQDKKFMSLQVSFFGKLNASIIYLANQIAIGESVSVFYSLNEFLILLEANFIDGLSLRQTGKPVDQMYDLQITYTDENRRDPKMIHYYDINEIHESFVLFSRRLGVKFGYIVDGKPRQDWQGRIFWEVERLADRISNSLKKLSGVTPHSAQSQSLLRLMEISSKILSNYDIDSNSIINNDEPLETIKGCIGIILSNFADKVKHILNEHGKEAPAGLYYFIDDRFLVGDVAEKNILPKKNNKE